MLDDPSSTSMVESKWGSMTSSSLGLFLLTSWGIEGTVNLILILVTILFISDKDHNLIYICAQIRAFLWNVLELSSQTKIHTPLFIYRFACFGAKLAMKINYQVLILFLEVYGRVIKQVALFNVYICYIWSHCQSIFFSKIVSQFYLIIQSYFYLLFLRFFELLDPAQIWPYAQSSLQK